MTLLTLVYFIIAIAIVAAIIQMIPNITPIVKRWIWTGIAIICLLWVLTHMLGGVANTRIF